MYDDKKYSPCYGGYTTDIQFNKLCELELERQDSQGIVTELYAFYVILYRNLTEHLPT